MDPLRVSICTVTGWPLVADRRLHGQLVDVGLQIFFLLPAALVQALAEISLAVKQPDADQRNVQIRSALDVIARQHAQAAGIDRQRFVHSELGGKIRHRPRPQDAGVRRAPGAVGLQIFLLAAVRVVDPAVQHQFARAALERRQRHLGQQRDGIVIQLPPAHRIQIAEQAGGIVVPAPPQIARQRPQPFLRRRDEAIERARLADHRRNLRGGFHQHPNFVLAEYARFDRLHHQHALQHAVIDQRDAQERLVGVFAGLAEILEARMPFHLLHGDRAHLLGHQAGQAFIQRHAQRADAFGRRPSVAASTRLARSGSSR